MRLYTIFTLILLLVFSSIACADDHTAPDSGAAFGGLLAKQDGGLVNWGDGAVSAVAEVLPMQDTLDPMRTRAIALRQGGVEARKQLLDTVLGLRLENGRSISSIYRDDVKTMNTLRGFVQNSLISTELTDDGAVKVSASLNIRNGLSAIIIPPTTAFLSGIAPTISGERSEAVPLQELSASGDMDGSESGVYSGIVIDARGFSLTPVLLPLIYDGRGVGVYGPFAVSRDSVIRNGLVSYMVDSSPENLRSRVGNSPLTVVPVNTQSSSHANLILSLEDGDRVRTVLRRRSVTENCAVVILVKNIASDSLKSSADLLDENLSSGEGVSGGEDISAAEEDLPDSSPVDNEAVPARQ